MTESITSALFQPFSIKPYQVSPIIISGTANMINIPDPIFAPTVSLLVNIPTSSSIAKGIAIKANPENVIITGVLGNCFFI